MPKIGRNNLCPCGSGKKYKKCCMMKKQTSSFTRSLVQKKTNELLTDILAFAEKEYDENIIAEAWEDFYDDKEDVPEDDPYLDLFYRWFLFYWFPEDDIDVDEDFEFPSPNTIGANYLKKYKSNIDSLSIRVLESALTDPLSFWQVKAVEPNRGILLKDLILGRERYVEDVIASQEVKKQDIILANMQEVDRVFIFNAISPYMLPPHIHDRIKEEIHIDPESQDALYLLFDIDLDLIYFLQDAIEETLAMPVPDMLNLDGSEIIFTASTYTFNSSSRKKIIDILLARDEFKPEDFGDPDMETFTWEETPGALSVLDSALKGFIAIHKDKLITQCNSSERDNQLRNQFQTCLGDLIRHHSTEEQPVNIPDLSDLDNMEGGRSVDLDELPKEDRLRLEKELSQTFMKWADLQVPALKDITPREAVKTSEGKKQVIKMINEWENQTAHMENNQFQFDFNKLRKDLGLPLD